MTPTCAGRLEKSIFAIMYFFLLVFVLPVFTLRFCVGWNLLLDEGSRKRRENEGERVS